MLFPTHLAIAALLGRLSRLSTPWLLVGAALPDLVDKPLGMIELTTLFHSVGHSLALLVPAVLLASRGPAGLAAAVGWGAHLLADAVHVVINGRPTDALFLFWPVVSPPDPLAIPPGEFFLFYLWSPSFYLELLLWLALAVVVVRHGRGWGDTGSGT